MSAHAEAFGKALPSLRTAVPGPRSRALAERLERVESRNITRLHPVPPIFWAEALGANVRDVDGNVFIDLTAGFGVATAGHAPPAVAHAISEQAKRLAHGLGDVHPSRAKVELLEKLAAISPGALSVSILGSAGAEAVEAALKTTALRTGSTGILAFERSYHGLTYGALAATHRPEFRAPFAEQLFGGVRFAPFPTIVADLSGALAVVDEILETADPRIGAIIVEPIQGRGGIRLPAEGFLDALRARADGRERVLIFDEIYTGIGRTGRWFACEHWNVLPDLLVVGKGLTGSVPLSAVIGSKDMMDAWPPSTGEAIHTSTFLGNPIACAAALAQIAEIERSGLLARASRIGEIVADRVGSWKNRGIAGRRGLGALQGVQFTSSAQAQAVADHALGHGVIVLTEGDGSTLAITPPLTITDEQLGVALDVVASAL